MSSAPSESQKLRDDGPRFCVVSRNVLEWMARIPKTVRQPLSCMRFLLSGKAHSLSSYTSRVAWTQKKSCTGRMRARLLAPSGTPPTLSGYTMSSFSRLFKNQLAKLMSVPRFVGGRNFNNTSPMLCGAFDYLLNDNSKRLCAK